MIFIGSIIINTFFGITGLTGVLIITGLMAAGAAYVEEKQDNDIN